MNKIRPLQPPQILAFHRGLYRIGEEYVKRDLYDLPNRMVDWPELEAGVLGHGHEAECREGSLRVVLWRALLHLDVHHNGG